MKSLLNTLNPTAMLTITPGAKVTAGISIVIARSGNKYRFQIFLNAEPKTTTAYRFAFLEALQDAITQAMVIASANKLALSAAQLWNTTEADLDLPVLTLDALDEIARDMLPATTARLAALEQGKLL